MGLRKSLSNSLVGGGSGATNGLQNGNFANGTTGWANISGCSLSASSNTLRLTGTGSDSMPRAAVSTDITCVTGKRVYISSLSKVTNSVCNNMRLEVRGSTAGSYEALNRGTPIQDTSYKNSAVVTITTQTGVVKIVLWHEYASSAIASAKVMEIREAIAIDVSTLPAFVQTMTDADVKAYCDALVWFNGTQPSSNTMSLNSPLKN